MRREGLGVGIFFLAAGVFFLLDAMELVDLRPEFLLPLLLIGFGIALIAAGRRPVPVEEREMEEREMEERDLEEREAEERDDLPPTPPPSEDEDRDG